MSENRSDSPTSPAELLQCGFRYACALTHHEADAEDLVQEAWLRLCRKYGDVDSKPLLFATIRRVHIDVIRRCKVVRFESIETQDEASRTAGKGDAAPGVAGDLEHVLGSLRVDERETIYLHHVEGYTAEEISRATRRPRNTVLSVLRRAMHKLSSAPA